MILFHLPPTTGLSLYLTCSGDNWYFSFQCCQPGVFHGHWREETRICQYQSHDEVRSQTQQRKFRIRWLPPLSYCTSLTGGHLVSAGMNTYNQWVHVPLPVYISEQLVAGKFFILCWTCKLCLLLTVFIRAINEWAGNAWAGWAPELELRVEIQALPLSSCVTLGDLS